MIDRPLSPKYHKNIERTNAYAAGKTPCAICGCAIDDTKADMAVHLVEGGLHLGKEGDEFDAAGDVGWYPIGPDCYRQHPEIHDYVMVL
jgi:hypothetical protein